MTKTFEELGLSADLIRALKENKFESPFPIQEAAIPLILQGKDVVGQAHTGTGKTAAFGLPILSRIKPDGPVQALILAPTRELAVQVTTEMLLTLRPDVVLELHSSSGSADISAWHSLPSVPAVRDGRVHVLTDWYVLLPGPQLPKVAEQLARALHPDAFAVPTTFGANMAEV